MWIVSILALAVSVLSLYFSRKSWRESNRPVVTAKVATNESGNLGTAFDLIVQNTGTRPAKNVRLLTDPVRLNALLEAPTGSPLRYGVDQCFSEDWAIPILENGKCVTNSFGFMCPNKSETTWKEICRFEIEILYEDIDGRRYKQRLPLFVADDHGFAGGSWGPSKDR